MTINVRARAGALNRSLGRRFGRALAPYPQPGALERELSLLIRLLGIGQIVDVGAHVGGFARRIRGEGFAGRIESFEPLPSAFASLRAASAGDQLWKAHEMALGSVDGELELHIFPGDGQFNSLRSLSAHADEYSPGLSQTGLSMVSVHRLDGVWPSLFCDPATTLLKVDTQGFDLEVLRGAGNLLEQIPAVLTEVAVQPLYTGAPLMEEVISYMRTHGFEMTGAFPIHRYGNGARVIEFDCTFVNIWPASAASN